MSVPKGLSEASFLALVLGPGVDQRTLGAGEGQRVAVRFQQVLADLGADALDQVTDVAKDRVVAAHRVARLQQVEQAKQAEHGLSTAVVRVKGHNHS